MLSCSALPRAHETLTYYSAGSCRSHAQEMARRLTEDTINQELMRLGLPNTAMIKAPSVVAWGGGSFSDKDLVALVAGICAAVALLLFVCVCYCWKKKKYCWKNQSQQVEMQQGAGNVNPSAPAGIVSKNQSQQVEMQQGAGNVNPSAPAGIDGVCVEAGEAGEAGREPETELEATVYV